MSLNKLKCDHEPHLITSPHPESASISLTFVSTSVACLTFCPHESRCSCISTRSHDVIVRVRVHQSKSVVHLILQSNAAVQGSQPHICSNASLSHRSIDITLLLMKEGKERQGERERETPWPGAGPRPWTWTWPLFNQPVGDLERTFLEL